MSHVTIDQGEGASTERSTQREGCTLVHSHPKPCPYNHKKTRSLPARCCPQHYLCLRSLEIWPRSWSSHFCRHSERAEGFVLVHMTWHGQCVVGRGPKWRDDEVKCTGVCWDLASITTKFPYEHSCSTVSLLKTRAEPDDFLDEAKPR